MPARRAPRAAEENARLLTAVVVWLRSLGGVPAIVVGDNLAVEGIGSDAALAMSGWADLFQQAGPACQPGNGM
eukprot:11205560-Lingulodinium_polyedra.AAC.1